MRAFHVALLCLLLASPAFAKTDAEVQSEIQNLLMMRHPSETGDWWRALGANAPSVIIQMFQATDKPYWQQRLLQGLGWFGDDPKAVDFLKQQAAGADQIARLTAIRSIGHVGASEEDFLAGFLKHSDPQTRIAAAEALRKIGDPHSGELVDRFLREEKTPWVASKVRGILPTPSVSAVPVASSEERLSPELVGSWHGYRLLPKAGSTTGMESQPVQATLTISEETHLNGKILVRAKGGKVSAYHLNQTAGRGSKFSGQLSADNAAQLADELPFEGMLSLESGSFLVQLRIPRQGAILVLRRDPR